MNTNGKINIGKCWSMDAYVIRSSLYYVDLFDKKLRVLADMLEVKDEVWQNAVEGYLNTQRFNILVDPEYYDIAAGVYDKNKSKIHSVALINTQALDLSEEVLADSLASVIQSDNRYTFAYAKYLLGCVVMCDDLDDLKKHKIAITKSCRLYQGRALRKIDPKIYSVPYVGQKEINNLERDILELENKVNEINGQIISIDGEISQMSLGDLSVLENAKKKYEEHKKTKSPGTIHTNYGQRKQTLENQKSNTVNKFVLSKHCITLGNLEQERKEILWRHTVMNMQDLKNMKSCNVKRNAQCKRKL
ncbi:hypothetical protein [Anaerocolumna jejuensis]|uniref:hypothetical protein n=1 Tax=Anaerocolumna jejuensis TaxID=259063 RepID=UPI003F7BCB5E